MLWWEYYRNFCTKAASVTAICAESATPSFPRSIPPIYLLLYSWVLVPFVPAILPSLLFVFVVFIESSNQKSFVLRDHGRSESPGPANHGMLSSNLLDSIGIISESSLGLQFSLYSYHNLGFCHRSEAPFFNFFFYFSYIIVMRHPFVLVNCDWKEAFIGRRNLLPGNLRILIPSSLPWRQSLGF